MSIHLKPAARTPIFTSGRSAEWDRGGKGQTLEAAGGRESLPQIPRDNETPSKGPGKLL